jgi:SMC interacting uncharacterized protein involved in chromosome segregation
METGTIEKHKTACRNINPAASGATVVTPLNGTVLSRRNGCESLADDLDAKIGNKYPNITGELKIVSENHYCQSCQGVIQQFNEMFPNVKLILIDGAK